MHKVSEYPNLIRDNSTNAILVKQSDEYLDYQKNIKQQKMINNIFDKLDSIEKKQDIIINLLSKHTSFVTEPLIYKDDRLLLNE